MATVNFNGADLKLINSPLAVGDQMPDARLFDNDLNEFKVSQTSGVRVFLTVPSLDTPVCDLEVRTFNTKSSELPGVSIFAISADLPFAQARWCAGSGIEAVQTLSDYNGGQFGKATGTFIQDLALLSRAVFIVKQDGQIAYLQYVPELGNPPDYEAAYACLAQLV
ncbi:MAG: thiol peroxidase [Coriobacteriia bacterium]|nr:thiol peroxidase [Coriobacteriia bacterium]